MAVNWYDQTCIDVIYQRIEVSLSLIYYFTAEKPMKEEVELSDFIIIVVVVDVCRILLV